jgi:hypothetical protein
VIAARTAFLQRFVAAALIFALALTGLGRGLAAAHAHAPAAISVGGIVVPICHSDPGDASGTPDRGGQHDCCDACALLAPAVLPGPPDLTAPAALAYFAQHVHAAAWVRIVARLRTPRQSQGPPTA